MIIQTLHEFNRHSSIGFFFLFFFFLLNGLLFLFLLCSVWFGLITTFFVQRLMYVTLYPISRIPGFILLFRIEGCLLNHLGELTMYQQSLLASSPQLYPYSWTICRWLQLSCAMAPLAPNCTAYFNLSLWIVQT